MSLSSYKAAKSQIALEALSMAPETTITIECPICQGGQTREKKLSVTRNHKGALFCCFRASCGFRGFVGLEDGQTTDQIQKPKEPEIRPYKGEVYQFPDAGTDFIAKYPGFHRGYNLDDLFCGHNFYTDSEGSYVFSCWSLGLMPLGHVVRTKDKTIKTFKATKQQAFYSYYWRQHYDKQCDMMKPLILVEDCISAMCVASHGFPAVALLGTNLPASLAERMRLEPKVVVMLDPDASVKAMHMAHQIGAVWAVGHTKDPKDMPALGEFLESYL